MAICSAGTVALPQVHDKARVFDRLGPRYGHLLIWPRRLDARWRQAVQISSLMAVFDLDYTTSAPGSQKTRLKASLWAASKSRGKRTWIRWYATLRQPVQ